MQVLRLLALAAFSLGADASSKYIAEQCRGGTCPDPRFPILDYSEEDKQCVCKAHPCWNDNGVTHRCPDSAFPFLHFEYSEDKTLTCTCGTIPLLDSIHVAKDLCPGQTCDDTEKPVLDWDPQDQKCICRSHPCNDLDGIHHECKDPKYPILHYFENNVKEQDSQHRCECMQPMEQPSKSLRGPKQESQQCVWAL
jgi:hypothetical protein